MKGLHAFNSCFLHGDYVGDRCPHPEHQGATDGKPPRDWWRNVPCGHPSDPVAWRMPDGHFVCHCGCLLNPDHAFDEPAEAPGPIVPCSKCGCYVALPRDEEVPA